MKVISFIFACGIAFAPLVAAQCTAPSYWADNVVSNCVPGSTVANGGNCTLSCAPPTSQYIASGSGVVSGQLVVSCNGNAFSTNTLTCVPNGSNLASVAVWCGNTGATYVNGYTYVTTSGTCTQFKTFCDPTAASYAIQSAASSTSNLVKSCCADAGSANTCDVLPSNQKPYPMLSCNLPITFADFVDGLDNGPECFKGYPLFPGQSCKVVCTYGPPANTSSVPATYSCSSTAELSSPAQPSCPGSGQCAYSRTFNANVGAGSCTSGFLNINGNCSVSCNSGYEWASGIDTNNCLPNGTGNPYLSMTVTLACQPASCPIPSTFGPNIITSTCTPGGQLTGSGAGSSCTVQCEDGFSASGNNTYSCSYGVRTAATLTCSGQTTCELPTDAHVKCTSGDLDNGECTVSCLTGYTPVNPDDDATYTCVNGEVSGTYTCEAASQNCPLPTGQKCTTGATTLTSGSECDGTCATGYKPANSQTTTVFTCADGELTSSEESFNCVRSGGCTLPSSFGYNVVGGTCVPNATLANNKWCSVRCASGCHGTSGTGNTGYYVCVNGVLRKPTLTCSGGGGGSGYCKGPNGMRLKYGVRYPVRGLGNCANFPGTTYVWCADRKYWNQYSYLYCCGSYCNKWGYNTNYGSYGYYNNYGQHSGYWTTNYGKKPQYYQTQTTKPQYNYGGNKYYYTHG